MSSSATVASAARTTASRTPGPRPHWTCAGLIGGPLGGLLLDFHGWRTEEVDDGVA